jgi:hypothetical protein
MGMTLAASPGRAVGAAGMGTGRAIRRARLARGPGTGRNGFPMARAASCEVRPGRARPLRPRRGPCAGVRRPPTVSRPAGSLVSTQSAWQPSKLTPQGHSPPASPSSCNSGSNEVGGPSSSPADAMGMVGAREPPTPYSPCQESSSVLLRCSARLLMPRQACSNTRRSDVSEHG